MSRYKLFGEDQAQEISPLVRTVEEFLMQKGLKEKIRPDVGNGVSLGGVLFFIDYPDNGTPNLIYNKHPSEWNEALIKQDIDAYEKQWMIEKGVHIHQ